MTNEYGVASNSREMTDFGRYITHEYGVLKQIFSNLTSKDLHKAALVCREWKAVATKFLEKSRTIQSCYLSEDTIWPELNRQTEASAVLLFIWPESDYSKRYNRVYKKLLAKLSSSYNMDAVHFLTLVSTETIMCAVKNGIIQKNPPIIDRHIMRLVHNAEDEDFLVPSESGLLLIPKFPGLAVKSVVISKIQSDREYQIEALRKVKALVVLVDSRRPDITLLEKFMDGLSDDVRYHSYSPPCLAGGVLYKILDKGATVHGPVVLAFDGKSDDVVAHSQIHQLGENDDLFWAKFVEAVGPQPPNTTRFAFIFSCINRTADKGDVSNFAKHFPGVPYYGFWSFGEFCFPGTSPEDTTGEPVQKKIKTPRPDSGDTHFHANCASFLILTVKNVISQSSVK